MCVCVVCDGVCLGVSWPRSGLTRCRSVMVTVVTKCVDGCWCVVVSMWGGVGLCLCGFMFLWVCVCVGVWVEVCRGLCGCV